MYWIGSPSRPAVNHRVKSRRRLGVEQFPPSGFAISEARSRCVRCSNSSTASAPRALRMRPVAQTRLTIHAISFDRVTSLRRLACFGLQLLRLVVRNQRIHNRLQPPLHDQVKLVQRQPNPVVGQPVLRKIIRADLLAPVAACPPAVCAPSPAPHSACPSPSRKAATAARASPSRDS